MAERRGLFELIFGRRPRAEPDTKVLVMPLSGGQSSIYHSAYSGDPYDRDVVRAAVDAIARNVAKLRPKHIRRGGDIQHVNSNLERLLAQRPNPYMNAYDFYYKITTQWAMRNNAFVYVHAPTGTPEAFYPVLASAVEFVQAANDPAGEIYAKFRFGSGQQVTLPYVDLIHLRRFFYRQDLFGEDNALALTPTLKLIQATDDGIVNAVQSSARLRGLLKFTAMLKPSDIRAERDRFVSEYMSISNDGGVAALDAKADYTPLDTKPQMIDDKQMAAIEDKVHKYFGINAAIIKSQYKEQEWNAFYESVIEPLAIQLSLEFTNKLFSERELGHGNEIIFEANRLQYASNDTKIRVITTLVDRGMMSLNQGLEVFNMPPMPDGEKRIVSLNFVDAEKANLYQVGIDDEDDNSSEDGEE